ncbi:pellicle/biofilm biosynthesis outer membrane protein PelC [Uliginosibacterium flavum]
MVLPFSNGTETPLAGQRAEAVALGLVQTLGVNDIQRYPQNMQEEKLFEFGQGQGYTQEQALMWARAQQARFALAGSVQEWRYKVGVDGEPVVGVSLRIVDLADGRVIWSAVGAKSGGSRESLAAAGQKLMKSMLEPVFSKN